MIVSLSLILFTVAVTPTFADSSETVNLDIGGGTLEVSSSTANFSDIEINYAQKMYSTTSGTVTVNDSRATGEGWVVTYALSPFEATGIHDPTISSLNDKISVRLLNTEVSLDIGNVVSLDGQDSTRVTRVSNTLNFFADNTPISILSAELGGGMGVFSATLGKTLYFENGVSEVTEVTGGSKLKVGDKLGILKGTYTATISLTAGSGL